MHSVKIQEKYRKNTELSKYRISFQNYLVFGLNTETNGLFSVSQSKYMNFWNRKTTVSEHLLRADTTDLCNLYYATQSKV